jgi:hypothetical protein
MSVRDSPPFSRRGARAIKSLEREGGREARARQGEAVIVVSKRSRSLLIDARVALLIFCLKLLTTPSAPLRYGIFLLMAQPPLLENGGECRSNPSYKESF